MNIKFNKNKIMQPNTCVHCTTLEQATQLLAWADSEGLRWVGGKKYLEDTNWDDYQKETVYHLVYGQFSDVRYANNNGYTVLPFDKVKTTKTISFKGIY